MKLLKCLVEDVVVDISFETIGGLRAATFLTSLDLEISKRCRGDCLFIRSVILVGGLSRRAWRTLLLLNSQTFLLTGVSTTQEWRFISQ